jgi:hypothetical protein
MLLMMVAMKLHIYLGNNIIRVPMYKLHFSCKLYLHLKRRAVCRQHFHT